MTSDPFKKFDQTFREIKKKCLYIKRPENVSCRKKNNYETLIEIDLSQYSAYYHNKSQK